MTVSGIRVLRAALLMTTKVCHSQDQWKYNKCLTRASLPAKNAGAFDNTLGSVCVDLSRRRATNVLALIGCSGNNGAVTCWKFPPPGPPTLDMPPSRSRLFKREKLTNPISDPQGGSRGADPQGRELRKFSKEGLNLLGRLYA